MFKLPDLSYSYDALENTISAEIMELHHSKHHQAYVNKLNEAVAKYPDLTAGKSIEDLLSNLQDLPEDIRTAVRNHGGGHYNHSLFWQWMSPNGGGKPGGELEQALIAKYGSYEQFIELFNTKALGLFGSGWVWLQPDLEIVPAPNQDSELMKGGAAPILGLDVWEHAYYLDYKNRRDDYIKKWWQVVNWQTVNERYEQSK